MPRFFTENKLKYHHSGTPESIKTILQTLQGLPEDEPSRDNLTWMDMKFHMVYCTFSNQWAFGRNTFSRFPMCLCYLLILVAESRPPPSCTSPFQVSRVSPGRQTQVKMQRKPLNIVRNSHVKVIIA